MSVDKTHNPEGREKYLREYRKEHIGSWLFPNIYHIRTGKQKTHFRFLPVPRGWVTYDEYAEGLSADFSEWSNKEHPIAYKIVRNGIEETVWEGEYNTKNGKVE